MTSFETQDPRRIHVNVAGPAALLVAKAHKLGERLATPQRLMAKDAGDVFRLFEATALGELVRVMRTLLTDERSADATVSSLAFIRQLFATPRAPGTRLAVQALGVAVDESTVVSTMTTYTHDLLEQLIS